MKHWKLEQGSLTEKIHTGNHGCLQRSQVLYRKVDGDLNTSFVAASVPSTFPLRLKHTKGQTVY